MSLFDIEFWKDVKVNDFTLACISTLAVIFPPVIGLFLLAPDTYKDLNFGSLILLCLSVGILFIGCSLNSIGHIFNAEFGNRDISFKLLRDIMPITIINLYSTFIPFFFISILPLKYFVIQYIPGLELFAYTGLFIMMDNILALARRHKLEKLKSSQNSVAQAKKEDE